jgi:VanZ family protein
MLRSLKEIEKTTRFFLLILLGFYFLFIVYASLINSGENAVKVRPEDAWFFIYLSPFARDFHALNVLRDITVNILFYFPFGIIAALVFSKEKPKYFSKGLWIGFCVSGLMETMQHFIGRHADTLDILSNTLGFIAGYEVVVAAMKRYDLRPLEFIGFLSERRQKNQANGFTALRFVYLCSYTFIALLPFDVSVNPYRIYDKLFAGNGYDVPRLVLNPLIHFGHGDWLSPSWMLTFLGYLPLAALTAVIGFYRSRISWINTVLYCLIFAVIVEAAQIFIMSQTTDFYNIVPAFAAGCAGWAGIRLWARLTRQPVKSCVPDGNSQAYFFLLCLYLIFLCAMAWAPYQFEFSVEAVRRKFLTQSNFVPFKYLHYHYRFNTIDLIKEFSLFIPVGILMALQKNRRRLQAQSLSGKSNLVAVYSLLKTGLFCFVFSGILELSQTICQGRYVDITDPVIGTAGSLIGAAVVLIYRRKGEGDYE